MMHALDDKSSVSVDEEVVYTIYSLTGIKIFTVDPVVLLLM